MWKYINKELLYGAKNYAPKHVCILKGSGVYVYDTNNKKYLDFISAYSAVNQGHCHPRLVDTMKKQSETLTLTSRALYNNVLGDYMEKITNTFNYDKVLPMNTGVEGGETALKLARMWGYKKKRVEHNKAVNLFCSNNFWGRTLAASSSSTDPSCYNYFGPFMNGFEIVPYNCISSLEKKFKENPNIVSFMLEPIQGEAGVVIPDNGYLKKVKDLCRQYNVLMIADEVQTGIGRTGKMLACDYEQVQPDILILGKALSGGMMPISAVLANNHIMDVMTPGTHGSTFGGNPLASAIAMEALEIIEDERLDQNAYIMGKTFRYALQSFDFDFIVEYRGKGLLNALEIENKEITESLSTLLQANGLLAKPTHDNILRLSPPLIIDEEQMYEALDILYYSCKMI